VYRRVRRRLTGMLDLWAKPNLAWQPMDSRVNLQFVPNLNAGNIPAGDAIFATGWQTVEPVVEYPANRGEKFYLIQHYETWMGPKPLVDATWQTALHKVVVSKWLLEVGKRLGSDDVAYVPNGIDHSRFKLLRPIAGRAPRVAMMFSKVPFKASADGLKAIGMARERHPSLGVVLFGTSRLTPRLPQWAEYHRDPPQEMLVEEIYNNSSIFVSSSLAEGFALPPAEASACGCAVAATDSGGIRDFVEHQVTGLLSAPGDPEGLAQNLCRLLEGEDRRVQLATAGMKRIRDFTWDESAARLEDFLLVRCRRAA